ncbi:MAG: flagellar protein [Anaerovibrio sp.]|uniref:flagellar protein n=1 Tax=Anaerovibrio sp. TaxID=1872532 RepID=UPI0025D04A88|nr:flagellar protein [Anaerovibrio sp.]MCR5176494.1 flagellar protein [Anaerovibrio sp.]
MNKLRNCPDCGKLYLEVGQNVCPRCYDLELEQEQIVYSYVRDHDKCSVDEIVRETGVKEKVVLRMIRSGRFVNNGNISYACESCGAEIFTGRFCEKCSQDLAKQASQLNTKKVQPTKVDRSHTMYNAGKEF